MVAVALRRSNRFFSKPAILGIIGVFLSRKSTNLVEGEATAETTGVTAHH
jgi:hypothetical protein